MERRRNVIRPFYQKSRFKAASRIVLLDPSFLFFSSPPPVPSLSFLLLRYRGTQSCLYREKIAGIDKLKPIDEKRQSVRARNVGTR